MNHGIVDTFTLTQFIGLCQCCFCIDHCRFSGGVGINVVQAILRCQKDNTQHECQVRDGDKHDTVRYVIEDIAARDHDDNDDDGGKEAESGVRVCVRAYVCPGGWMGGSGAGGCFC